MDSEVKEFRNALVTIKGNALRCGNCIYSIHNIVSLTFDSVRKETGREKPVSIDVLYLLTKLFFIYFISTLVLVVLIDIFNETIMLEVIFSAKKFLIKNQVLKSYKDIDILFTGSIVWSFILGLISCWIRSAIENRYLSSKYYYLHGLKIVFVNNFSLFLISSADTGFIRDTIDNLYLFISTAEISKKKELVINFSDRSINIKESISSNIIGGNVQGDVKNG